MSEYYKEKIKNLIALRTNLFTVVIVLTGGVISLVFMDIPFMQILPLALIGIYYDFVFLKNIFSINNTIDSTLEELRQ